MFEEIKKRYYESLTKSIKDRRKFLKVIRDDILPDPKRVTNIEHIIRDAHHPYLIGRDEYPRLIYLFLCKDHNSFEKINITNADVKILKENCNNNYDKMLWEHIDWDKMFQDVIAELSKSNRSEELGEIFEGTLIDYVPYAVIKYDKTHPEFGRIFKTNDEIEGKRQNAIEWVYLRHGSEPFKQAFYKKFSGKILREFDEGFHEFVKYYLEERKPNQYSFGSEAYSILNNMSGYEALLYSLPEVRYGDVSDKKSEYQTLLEEYIENRREQMNLLEKYQKKFDELHIDIK